MNTMRPVMDYDITEITRLLLNMRDNCVRKAEGEAYDDPERKKKYEALNAAIDLINNPSMLHVNGDLISLEAALDEVRDIWCRDCHCATTKRDCKACNVGDFMNRLRDLPAVDAVPVVHGRWRYEASHRGRTFVACHMICDRCRATVIRPDGGIYNYCHNCGAKMDK